MSEINQSAADTALAVQASDAEAAAGPDISASA